MTVPGGGVISLPPGASTLDTLEYNLQNMSGPAMKARAVDRFPGIMDSSTGGSPAVDLTPFGILTNIWAGTNSLVAQADPADIQGPEDLPGLLLDFIEGLPVIGQLVQLVEAILGTYDGDDGILLTIQGIFDPIRKLMQMITGIFTGFPSVGQVELALPDFIKRPLTDLVDILVNVLDSIPIIGPPVGNALEDLAAIFGLLRDKTAASQGSADTANVGVAILNARVNEIITGGVSIYDSFSRDVPDMATDPDWDVSYAGGSGNMALVSSGDGRARWAAVGFSDTSFIARHKTALGSNRQRVSMVIDDFTYGFAGNQAHIWLMGRMDATRTYAVIGVVEDGLAEIGYLLNGTYTRMGGQEYVSTATGDLWDLEIGNGTDEWRFRLLQNNSVRVDRTDLSHLSPKDTTPGTTYKYAGFGGDCAIGAGPFGQTYQIGMPDTQVFAAADY